MTGLGGLLRSIPTTFAKGAAMGVRIQLVAGVCAVLFLSAGSIAQAQNVVLTGTVVTPEKVIPKGWIVVKQGRITAVLDKAPGNLEGPLVDTNGIIFPGFIDLHNHPMYNIFKRWVPKAKFKNRYEWRDLQEYKDLVGTPGGELQRKDDQTFCDVDEYVEVKELIGGTTSIAGISPRKGANPPVPTCVSGLARNLDWASGFYGSGIGNERIESTLGVAPRDLNDNDSRRISKELADKKIDLLLIHVAEGSAGDTESTVEFRALKGLGLLSEHVAIIHGAALGSDDFRQMRENGAALIWSPRSNMELYGSTANVAAAVRQGVTIALAPDWSPTGSINMLAELQFASRFSRERLFGLFSDRELFEMATTIPARIAGIDDKVGSLQPGLYADLVVLAGDVSQPFTALVQARPEDVQLVLVGGVPVYGSEKLVGQFRVPTEPLKVCKTSMVLNSLALPAGKFGDVTERLKTDLGSYKLELGSLEECAE
jgi:cytosine/adenosine deaminase-related metal-dependent hydrolase